MRVACEMIESLCIFINECNVWMYDTANRAKSIVIICVSIYLVQIKWKIMIAMENVILLFTSNFITDIASVIRIWQEFENQNQRTFRLLLPTDRSKMAICISATTRQFVLSSAKCNVCVCARSWRFSPWSAVSSLYLRLVQQ